MKAQSPIFRFGRCMVIVMMAAAPLVFVTPVIAQDAPVVSAEAATLNAGQILFEKQEYAAARELLRAYVGDAKAAITYVRAGLALKATDANDLTLMSALSANGNAVASRILGDLLRAGPDGTADLAAAEAAYRLAVTQGDKTSEQRVAQILAMTERFPEAIAAYKALIDEVPAAEPRYLILAITEGGITDPAELAPLVARLDVLAQTDASAARWAASIFEQGRGVEQDAPRAVAYARQAMALGDTNIGLSTATDCETCSSLDIVALLKGSKLGTAEETEAALELPLRVGLYEDSFEIMQRFPPAERLQLAERFVGRFKAMSNPVVGLTQALLNSRGYYSGAMDGKLGSETFAALTKFTNEKQLPFTRFDEALVLSLFAQAD